MKLGFGPAITGTVEDGIAIKGYDPVAYFIDASRSEPSLIHFKSMVLIP